MRNDLSAVQLGLFGLRDPVTIVDDESGRIVYYPDVLDVAEAHALFEWLLEHAAWNNETMWMYDRMVDVPRMVARYRIDELPKELEFAHARVAALLGASFSSAGLNLYRSGRDSVAWHNDHLAGMPPRPTIALLSLGATRKMQLRTKRRPRTTHAIDLEAGSVLEMSGRSQEFWEHTIPKTPRPVSTRISIAFRPRSIEGTHSGMDDSPKYERDVESDRPYEEDASVPGDNDPKTALDPEEEREAER